MLDQNDIKQIDAVVTKRLDERFALSDKKLDERFVAYDKKLDERFIAYDKKLDERFATNNKIIVQEVVMQVGEFIQQNVLPQIDTMSRKLTTMPDKDFLTRQIAEATGKVIAHLRTQNSKVNLLIKFLREQKLLTDEQLQKLQEFEVFPSLENLAV